MISFKKLWRNKRGNVLAIAAAALPLVIGSAGLASDTIQWALWKRQLQRAADSAALAGVYAKVQNHPDVTAVIAVDEDLDRSMNFSRASKPLPHKGITLLSGYPMVDYPTGAGWTNPVRVKLALRKKLGFSSLFMSSAPTIEAWATAATIDTGVYCVVSLINKSSTGIKSSGTADVDLGCGMITNSTSLTAAIATGTSKVNATPIAAVGEIKASDNWGGADLLPHTVEQADPYEDVDPDTSSCTSPVQKLDLKKNQPVPTVTPGCYSSIKIDTEVTLPSGTYIIDGGDLSFGPDAKVTCNGCTFVLTNSDTADPNATIGGIDIQSTSELHLHAPMDQPTNPYDGILIYQDRRAKEGTVQTINGNSESVMEGALYFPRQELKIDGTAGIEFTCAQFVAYVVNFAGTGKIVNTCDDYGDKEIMGKHVRLVA